MTLVTLPAHIHRHSGRLKIFKPTWPAEIIIILQAQLKYLLCLETFPECPLLSSLNIVCTPPLELNDCVFAPFLFCEPLLDKNNIYAHLFGLSLTSCLV